MLAFSITRIGLSQYFQMPINTILARTLHSRLFRVYIYSLGVLYYVIRSAEAKEILRSFFLCLGGRVKKKIDILKVFSIFLGIFEHYYEKLLMAYKPIPEIVSYIKNRLDCENLEPLQSAARSGKGAILVTGHFGAVEFLPVALTLKGFRVAMVVRYKTARLKRELTSKADALGIELIDVDEPNALFKSLKSIQKGKMLIIECDEFSQWRLDSRHRVSIFGHSVPRDKTLDFFYKRSGAQASLVLLRRSLGGRYTLCARGLADGTEKLSLTHKAWNAFEHMLIRHPEQWYQWKSLIKSFAGYMKKERDYDPVIPTTLQTQPSSSITG